MILIQGELALDPLYANLLDSVVSPHWMKSPPSFLNISPDVQHIMLFKCLIVAVNRCTVMYMVGPQEYSFALYNELFCAFMHPITYIFTCL